MQGQLSVLDVPCPSHPPLTENRIDSSRTQVKWFYVDLLGRSPDPSGWDDWTSVTAQCVFDLGCIQNTRTNTALGFFFSGEFIQRIAPTDPVMANPPGSPGSIPRMRAIGNRGFRATMTPGGLHEAEQIQPTPDHRRSELISTRALTVILSF